ncbi:MAG: hypothetical protein HS132_02705 [Planctomycetia bacterium]|nr:hypothetical protein [Planctomycetia bacterium]
MAGSKIYWILPVALAYAIAFAKANPQLHAVVFDLRHVINLTHEFIKAHWKTVFTIQAETCLKIPLGRMSTMRFVSNLLHILQSCK